MAALVACDEVVRRNSVVPVACDEVVKRNPYHFGVLAGYAQIYARMEYYERALEYSRRALEINPNMTGVKLNIELLERLLEQRRRQTI